MQARRRGERPSTLPCTTTISHCKSPPTFLMKIKQTQAGYAGVPHGIILMECMQTLLLISGKAVAQSCSG